MDDRSGIEPHVISGIEPHRLGSRKETRHSMPPSSGTHDASLLATAINLTSMAILNGHFRSHQSLTWRPTSSLWRREAWVRSSIAQQALLQRLRVGVGKAHSATVSLRPDGQGADEVLLTLMPPTAELLQSAAEQVLHLKDDRADRIPEILVQATDMWPFWTLVTGIDPTRAPRTFELMEVAAQLSPWIGQPIKHMLNVDRPSERSVRVQPLIPVPGHASYPSGHATGAWLFATVMKALLNLRADHPVVGMLENLAGRIAQNREVAGLHDALDSAAGRELGITLGQFFVASCQGGSAPTDLVFEPQAGLKPLARESANATTAIAPLPVLEELWGAARTELGVVLMAKG